MGKGIINVEELKIVSVFPLASSLTTSIQEKNMRIIKNTSVYKTKRLKSLFCYIHEGVAYWGEGRLRYWKVLRIKVRGTQKRRSSGCAYYPSSIGSYEYDMFLTLNSGENIWEIIQLFAHELMHNYGYSHRQFRRDPLDKHMMEQIMKRFPDAEDLKI